MKHLFTLIILSFFLMGMAAAQGISYQAVVRDDTQHLVSNSNIGVQLSIIKNGEHGIVMLQERHFPTSDINGLISFEIGNGTVVYGDFDNIDWSAGDLWVRIELDLNGGSNYQTETIVKLLSVPYSFYAAESGTAKVAEQLQGVDFAGWDTNESDDFSGDYSDLWNAPDLFSGRYDDLLNKPVNVSEFNNDIGYITIEDIPTKLSEFENDTRFLTEELDGDDSNEIQDLMLIGNALFLTKSTTPVDLTGLDESAEIQVLNSILERLENKLETLNIRCDRKLDDLADSLQVKARRLELRIEALEE